MYPCINDVKNTDNLSDGQKCAVKILKKLEGHTNLRSFQCVAFPAEQVKKLCDSVTEIFSQEQSLLRLKREHDDPNVKLNWIIVGDLHGRYNELWKIVRNVTRHVNSKVQEKYENRFIFLGDYVDRGSHSLELILLLFAWKILFPHMVLMIRGNHEVMKINYFYGFYQEVLRKYRKGRQATEVYRVINETFCYLPLAIILNNIFCVHGGLSPLLSNVEQIDQLKIPLKILENTIEYDILWADPDPYLTAAYVPTTTRGPKFGEKAVEEFLKNHDEIDQIIRAHQCVTMGYLEHFDKKCITVFSAPGYKTGQRCAAVYVLYHDDKRQPLYITVKDPE